MTPLEYKKKYIIWLNVINYDIIIAYRLPHANIQIEFSVSRLADMPTNTNISFRTL